MLTAGQLEWAYRENLTLVPVPRHLANVTSIGVARLRYRPRTKMTAAWWAEYGAKSKHHFDRYNALAAERGTEAMRA